MPIADAKEQQQQTTMDLEEVAEILTTTPPPPPPKSMTTETIATTTEQPAISTEKNQDVDSREQQQQQQLFTMSHREFLSIAADLIIIASTFIDPFFFIKRPKEAISLNTSITERLLSLVSTDLPDVAAVHCTVTVITMR